MNSFYEVSQTAMTINVSKIQQARLQLDLLIKHPNQTSHIDISIHTPKTFIIDYQPRTRIYHKLKK